MPKKRKNLVVGAGMSGASLARLLAERGESVLVVDAKDHVGGNCRDRREDGIMVHTYGTHIFHTNNKEVWDFLSRFTKWHPYQHKVLGLVDGQTVPVPFNLNSLRMVFPKNMADRLENRLLDVFGFNRKVPILELRESGDGDLQFLAEYIHQKIFLEYTLKQWGCAPDELEPAVTGRVPVHISRDDRYFQDRYQGIPLDGFTALVEKMLDHPNIVVRLNTPFDAGMEYDRLFHTGSIDEFFGYRLGELPYRSISLDFVKFAKPRFQGAAVVNYPCNYDWTRIGEHKWFLDDRTPHTIVSFEYPAPFRRGVNERYYPIIDEANVELHGAYQRLAGDMPNIRFFGRLGDYKYYDMDKAVARAMEVFALDGKTQ